MASLQQEIARDSSLGPYRAQELEIVLLNFCFTSTPYAVPLVDQRFIDRDVAEEGQEADDGALIVAFLASYFSARANESAFDFLWYWIANFLSLPVTRGSAKIILYFLEYAGPSMRRRYGVQFTKLLDVTERKVVELESKPFAREIETATQLLRRCITWLRNLRS
jgi:hypothetical protein